MRGGAVFRAVGVMPSKDDGAGTDTFDRISPMGNAEHRQRPSPYGMASGTFHHKTEWLSSVFRDALPDKDFYDRSATHRLIAATCRRLCRFARTSLHWHRLRLNGTARFPFCFSVFHSPSAIQGLPTDMPLCAVIPGVPFNQGITLTDGQV